MEIRLELGYEKSHTLKEIIEKTRLPFWFTGDATIHLSSESPIAVFDISTLTQTSLMQLWSAVQNEEILTDQSEEIEKMIQSITTDDADLVIERAPKDKDTVVDLKNNTIEKDAQKALGVNAKTLIKQIGTADIKDGLLPPGINDRQLLEVMLVCETNDKNRQSVVAAISQRINAINESGVQCTQENINVSESALQDIIIDTVNKEIRPLE